METLEKLKVQKMLSALTIAIGFVLMSGKIYADSEPGAIPNTFAGYYPVLMFCPAAKAFESAHKKATQHRVGAEGTSENEPSTHLGE